MNRILKAALCAAVLLCGVGSVSSSALATGCPSGNFCVWKDNGFATAGSTYNYFGYPVRSNDYGAHNYANTSQSAHDSASSWQNAGNTNNARMYKDTWLNGTYSGPKAPGSAVGDMVDDWNDSLDSGCFLSGSSCL